MTNSSKSPIFVAVAVLVLLWMPTSLAGQESLIPQHHSGPVFPSDALADSELPASPVPAARQPIAASMFAIRPVEAPSQRNEQTHRFWDRENYTLFAVSAGWATADFFVTRSNLANGGRELNPVARFFAGSNAGLATNFALETGGVMGISYIFHKTGHHRLERAASLVNISASAGAVAFDLAHR